MTLKYNDAYMFSKEKNLVHVDLSSIQELFKFELDYQYELLAQADSIILQIKDRTKEYKWMDCMRGTGIESGTIFAWTYRANDGQQFAIFND